MRRREFTLGVVGLGFIAASEPLKIIGDLGASVGGEHVGVVREALARIEAQDAAVGSGAVLPAVRSLAGEVEAWLVNRPIDRHVSDDLHSTLGALHSWAGWLALDSADPPAADRHLKNALIQARLTDDPCLEAEVMDTYCMVNRARPRLALDCADAATSVSRGWATPRLNALLCLRKAVGHAKLGEASTWSRQIARAARYLDAGESEDDPLFTMFVNEQELAGIRGISLLHLGEPVRAAQEFRSIIDNPDPDRRRNTAYYHVRLGLALAEAGDITEASLVGCDALQVVTGVESKRTMGHLHELHARCAPHSHSAAARDFAEQYRQTV